MPADKLEISDVVTLISGFATLAHVHIENSEGGPFTTYNLAIDVDHTYFVGTAGVWVHNTGKWCDEAFEAYRHVLQATGDQKQASAAAEAILRSQNVAEDELRRVLRELETNHGPAGDLLESKKPLDRRTDHAKERAAQGRRTGPAFNGAQRAGMADIYIQADGRWVVQGPKGREHIFESDGKHLTSVDRSAKAHQGRVMQGDRRRVTVDEFKRFKELVK